MKEAICISESSYSHSLTRGKIYQILEKDVQRNQLCLIGDNGRKRWFAVHCFDFEKYAIPMLQGFTIDDPIIDSNNGAIEVTLEFTNNEKRWCLFITPVAFANGGDTIQGAGVTFHYNIKHLIVVDSLNTDAIGKILD